MAYYRRQKSGANESRYFRPDMSAKVQKTRTRMRAGSVALCVFIVVAVAALAALLVSYTNDSVPAVAQQSPAVGVAGATDNSDPNNNTAITLVGTSTGDEEGSDPVNNVEITLIEESPELEPTPTPTPTPPPTASFTLSAIGDIMAHEPQIKAAKRSDGSYDFSECFAYISDKLGSADITLANFETTVTGGTTYKGYPRFNAPASLLDAVKDAGVDVLTLANNHMLDNYCEGAFSTVEAAESRGFFTTGAYTSQEKYDATPIYEVNGVKLAILGYAQQTNGMENSCNQSQLKYTIKYIKKDKVIADIKKAREAGADIVIIFTHWGAEYKRKPDDQVKAWADAFAEAGADIILGSHPHVVQPVSHKTVTREDGSEHEVFIAYSMGNFISNQRDRYKDTGVIFNLTVSYDFSENKMSVTDSSYTPTWVWLSTGNKTRYQVLASGDYLNARPDGISAKDYTRLKESYQDIVSLMGDAIQVSSNN